MKLKKITQVMALSSTLALSIPTQQAQAASAISTGGATTPIVLTVLSGAFGGFIPLITSPISSAILGCVGGCIDSDGNCDGLPVAIGITGGACLGGVIGVGLWALLFGLALDETPDEFGQLELLDENTPSSDMPLELIENYNDQVETLNPLTEKLFFECIESAKTKDNERAKKAHATFLNYTQTLDVDIKLIKEVSEKAHKGNANMTKIIEIIIAMNANDSSVPVA